MCVCRLHLISHVYSTASNDTVIGRQQPRAIQGTWATPAPWKILPYEGWSLVWINAEDKCVKYCVNHATGSRHDFQKIAKRNLDHPRIKVTSDIMSEELVHLGFGFDVAERAGPNRESARARRGPERQTKNSSLWDISGDGFAPSSCAESFAHILWF